MCGRDLSDVKATEEMVKMATRICMERVVEMNTGEVRTVWKAIEIMSVVSRGSQIVDQSAQDVMVKSNGLMYHSLGGESTSSSL